MADDNLVAKLDAMSLFRPPIVRSAAATLNRALFSKTIPTAAARIPEPRNIARIQKLLTSSKELLRLDRLRSVTSDPDPSLASKGGKCLLLNPEVKAGDSSTWSETLQEASKRKEITVIPYDLELDYNYWQYIDIMTSILPEDAHEEIPVGFSVVGHIAHLNLRDAYLPYKKVIGQVIADKNPKIKTVINKIDNVGEKSQFRTFDYEVLYGPDDMNVEVSEEDCIYKFEYSKVYWNTRLHTEHKRLVDSFQAGEVVCDVMAGVGPFALPAGKKGVFVWANDLNPVSYKYLQEGITRNKVSNHVRPFNQDGHAFIRNAADNILSLTKTHQNKITINLPPKRGSSIRRTKFLIIPPTISHFVMNLPAIAISFLPSFRGLYHNQASLFTPHTSTPLPMIHVHCFSTKSDDNVRETKEICGRVSRALGYEVRPGNGEKEGECSVWEVRDVAPKKRMFCASFRLPAEVAFGERREEDLLGYEDVIEAEEQGEGEE